ncbi:tetraacyldisaccharide 4'-kinase [Urechidicola vernalis]|uniref:Tetraacyldisaccharide 4'-kinase n=1 Tax=Urechidicola vernalis TaxID=3075600 RepID=A0ABU2Y2E1_9FLAO|nr:tetraacyldisaccharide 4'-kinase [Urechidicola sp. P050]MDT0552366.1 tetraacyldisaccharide 4'-kinase [Urechidicola sp. P050]
MSVFRKLLFPFSILYDGVTFVRNKLFDTGVFRSTAFDIPVIVVGNLSVGGTGKTPQIEYLVRLLQKNCKVAVLSRGYKRKSTGFLLGNDNTKVQEIGDEPFQFFNKFKEIYVAVDEDRVHGINKLKSLENPPDLILLDDAFQHRKVNGKTNVLLTPYNDLYIDDLVLPAGNLREGSRGANRASVVVVTKCPGDLSMEEQDAIRLRLKLTTEQHLFFTTIQYSKILKSEKKEISLDDIEDSKVLLVTGIANPTPLVSYLKSKKIEVEHVKFGDHHNFSEGEIIDLKNRFEKITSKNKVILTTEKDFMRLKSRLDVYYIEIEVAFLSDGKMFDNLVKGYVG